MEIHTSQEARHLFGIVISSDSLAVSTHLLQPREGQQLTSIVCESLVHTQQPAVSGEVTQVLYQLFV